MVDENDEKAKAALTRILAKGFGVYDEETMLRRAFETVDVDGSGTIEVSEAPKIARLFYGDMPNTDETMRAYHWMDRNRDGMISFQEFKDVLLPLETTGTLEKYRDDDGDKHFNEYVGVKVLGQGAFGKVKEVKSTRDGGRYAMKQISKSRLKRPKKRGQPPPLAKFQVELDIMKKLRHPNVIRLYEIIDDDEFDKLYLIMEFADGGEAGPDDVGDMEPMPTDRILDIARQAILGLDFLHNQGVIHRDIKPANLLLTKDGTLKYADFNVSHMFPDSKDDLIKGTEGTPAFYSPEMCAGGEYHGKPADVWALGVTLYSLAYAAIPFPNPNLMTLFDDIQSNPIDFPETIDFELRDLLKRMLEKDPANRATLEECMQHKFITKGGTHNLVQVPMGALMELRKSDSIVERLSRFAFDKPSVVDRMKRFAQKRKRDIAAGNSMLGLDSPNSLALAPVPSGLHMMLELDELREMCDIIFDEIAKTGTELCASDIEKLLKKLGLDGSPEQVQRALEELDMDRSGQVCVQEFFGGFAGGSAVQSLICNTINDRIFSALKVGQEPPFGWRGRKGEADRWLSGDRAVVESLNPLQMKWFKDEFAKCDMDRDGTVVVQEIQQILKGYKPFVADSVIEKRAADIIAETKGPMNFDACVDFLTRYQLTKVSNAFDMVFDKERKLPTPR